MKWWPGAKAPKTYKAAPPPRTLRLGEAGSWRGQRGIIQLARLNPLSFRVFTGSVDRIFREANTLSGGVAAQPHAKAGCLRGLPLWSQRSPKRLREDHRNRRVHKPHDSAESQDVTYPTRCAASPEAAHLYSLISELHRPIRLSRKPSQLPARVSLLETTYWWRLVRANAPATAPAVSRPTAIQDVPLSMRCRVSSGDRSLRSLTQAILSPTWREPRQEAAVHG